MTATWQKEQQEKQARDKKLAHDVARELSVLTGQEWKAVNTGHEYENWDVAGPDNRRIDVHPSREKGKIYAGGVLERNPPVYGSVLVTDGNPSILVAEARGAAVIAKEIVRRLLPGYETVFLKNREAIRLHNDYEAKRDDARNCLAAAFGVKRPNPERERERFWARGHIVQVGANSVTMELRSLPLDVALRIAEIVRAHETKGGAK